MAVTTPAAASVHRRLDCSRHNAREVARVSSIISTVVEQKKRSETFSQQPKVEDAYETCIVSLTSEDITDFSGQVRSRCRNYYTIYYGPATLSHPFTRFFLAVFRH